MIYTKVKEVSDLICKDDKVAMFLPYSQQIQIKAGSSEMIPTGIRILREDITDVEAAIGSWKVTIIPSDMDETPDHDEINIVITNQTNETITILGGDLIGYISGCIDAMTPLVQLSNEEFEQVLAHELVESDY